MQPTTSWEIDDMVGETDYVEGDRWPGEIGYGVGEVDYRGTAPRRIPVVR